jgi:uncharacterized membrane protein
MAGPLRQIASGRFFGHPIHLMLVHFPAGLFPTALALDSGALIFSRARLAVCALFVLGGGVMGGVLAALFGSMDYLRLASDHPAWRKASLHGALNLLWLAAFTAMCAAKAKDYPDVPIPSAWEVATSATLVAGVLVSNYLGGELVLRHGVGLVER